MLVKRLKGRNTNGVVELHGEVLFAPGTDLSRWKNTLSHRVTAATAAAAPVNKRPRWGHYGKPLKTTFTASTSTRITSGGGFFYIAVGSRSAHAYYVDQGTGIYGGNGPYEAKILPPYQYGSASLYESTWRPGGDADTPRVASVMIKGQRGQHFFDRGLRDGFASVRMRSFQLPGEGISAMASSMASFPSGLFHSGSTTNASTGGGLMLSLRDWRLWRDEAWRAGEGLGRGGGIGSRSHAKFMDKAIRAHQQRLKNDPNFAKFIASKQAADRRKLEERERLAKEREVKAIAKEKRAAEQAEKELTHAKNRARRTALAFAKSKTAKGATDVSGRWITTSTGQPMYMVTWTTRSGKHKTKFFGL